MADFDMIRDQTLLFFLYHLTEKGQPRSLHDLSCQFGAKGFTKEMRQIAGGSQSGLKKFLSQFPSLFTIEGNEVFITPLTSNKNGPPARDYTKETIEFFSDKLVSYGNAEVPLKSLFGHRSQASSEIRHVSGQNVKEFKDFLCAHSDIFVVRDDYVVLQSVLEKLEQNGQTEPLRRMPEEITLDPYLMQQLVDQLEQTIFNLTDQYSNKISIEFLFNTIKFKEKLPPLWENFVKLPTDLTTFLHMNSRVFSVQLNMVSLTAERERILREKLHSPNKRDEPPPSPSLDARLGKGKLCNSNNDIQNAQSTETNHHNLSSHTSLSAKVPVLNPANPSDLPTLTTNVPKIKTFNQRIRSQIIKAVSENIQYDNTRNSHMQSSYLTTEPNDDSTFGQSANEQHFDSLDLQFIRPKIIVTSKECEEVIADILQHCTEVAIDLEGVNLCSSGEVTLIQIACMLPRTGGSLSNASYTDQNVPKVYLFDILLNRYMLDHGLRALLESEQIVKIGHDVRHNSVVLYKTCGITLKSVFDTQVAHLILQQQLTGKPAYKPTKYISLYTLCSLYGGPNLNPKNKDKLHKSYRKDYKYWQRRPLTDEMLHFAVMDVYVLLPTVYRTMRSQIQPEYEPLLHQLIYESVFTYINADEIKQIKRQRKFKLELTDLQLKLFNNEKKKIVLSNREIRLLRYIDLTDEIRNKIEGPQNVAKKLKRFENKKTNGTENSEEQSHVGNGVDKDGNHVDSKQVCSKLSTLELSDEDSDETDEVMENDGGLEEGETENESPNVSLKSQDYMAEFNSFNSPESFCSCNCKCSQGLSLPNAKTTLSTQFKQNGHIQEITSMAQNGEVTSREVATQTLSTGDIVITTIYFDVDNSQSAS